VFLEEVRKWTKCHMKDRRFMGQRFKSEPSKHETDMIIAE
jgi:hypothetical protein